MRKMIIVLFVISCISCSVIRIAEGDLINQKYVQYNDGMGLGRTVIIFSEQGLFNYSERDSLFVGGGKWKLSEDKKYLSLNGKVSDKHNNPDFTLEKSLNLKLKIKNENILIDEKDKRILYRKE